MSADGAILWLSRHVRHALECPLSASPLEDVLAKLRASATDTRDQGDKFERMMVRFFKTDIQWTQRFDDVWLWMDWPDRPQHGDHGIDLVARDRETGDLTAIQCKFYDPAATIRKDDIDSFLSESGKHPFKERIVVSTTDRWGTNAEQAIENQQIPVVRLRFMDLADSSIDWSLFDLSEPETMAVKPRKRLRPHQSQALSAVRSGFASTDRGKLIMACGTGKTFTSLRVAEELVGAGGRVLFLVPSISLLSQSLTEWSTEAAVPLRTFAVCSDTKVGKSAGQEPSEDIPVVDLALPATTDPVKLHARLSNAASGADKLTVVFSTYQSIDVVHRAQQLGSPGFDLVICDEAHRTTGATLPGEDESAFVRVHDDAYVRAAKRLYMTATPRIYDDSSKAKAGQANVVIASMDDEKLFGPEFHRLGFGEAVSLGLLADYKVLVLAVDEEQVSKAFQMQLAENSELRLDDIAKIVGCWNGLAKRKNPYSDFGGDDAPMARAVAFAGTIANSKKFAGIFTDVVADYIAQHEASDDEEDATVPLRCEAQHVDGTFNVLERNSKLDWLRAPAEPDSCRVLSNARCLSEGIDVPALDAVMFLNPRKSVVDVVQSVGRVMRKAPGKQYGYIILPIGIPSSLTPEQALGDNKRYQVVWEVLQALRAHDERFNAMINKIELNKGTGGKIEIIGVNVPGGEPDDQGPPNPKADDAHAQPALPLQWLDEWREAIYAKIVTKVGSRRYWEDWAKDIAVIAERHTTRIRALLSDPSLGVSGHFDHFLVGLRKNLNDSIDRDAAIDMLAQHLITRPVFEAIFDDYAFAEHNPVSKAMQAMLDVLDEQNVDAEADTLQKFYDSVRLRAEGIKNAEDRQKIITDLYERFFKNAFPRTAESLGIVYTPTQVIDFIVRSADHILAAEFGKHLTDEGVHILDPFTGTGTFMVRLLQSGLIKPEDLPRKYTRELHANEILLLAYYIAAINIEAAYHGVTAHDGDAGYVPFDGIVLTDTFHMTEDGGFEDHEAFPANSERAKTQRAHDVSVIIGNPPYSVGQTSGNDNNANLKYPHLDQAIAGSYAVRSTATNKNSLYDSYIRAFRWASDRIKDRGVIGFVSNGGFIDGNTADGLRKTFAAEFTAIYIYNLRGNARTSGELRRKEKDSVFGQGARTTVAITLLVKNPAKNGPAVLHYKDIGDYLTREQKLGILDGRDIASMDWTEISPNDAGDWINQRNSDFQAFIPVGDKDDGAGIFRTYSGGLKTNRDSWVYNSSRAATERGARATIDFYNSEVDRYAHFCKANGIADPAAHVDGFINTDATRISWNRADKNNLGRGTVAPRYSYQEGAVRIGVYRPFEKQHVYFDRQLNDMIYQLPIIFPEADAANLGIYCVGMGSAVPFSVLMVDAIPNLHVTGAGSGGQFFPRFTYADSGKDSPDLFDDDLSMVRVDNITDVALSSYRAAYGPQVTKDDIFHYIYGLLHSPDYRSQFAADLKKMLPRIPQVAAGDDFRAFAAAGTELAALHVNYERVRAYPLRIGGEPPADMTGDQLYDHYHVDKMRFGGKAPARDRSTVIYNSRITVSGIPDEAHEYLLGSRSGVEWVIERYQVKTDKASGIVNDPNDWSREAGDPRYILDLLARVVTVSIETVGIVKSLPPLSL
jgi:predicted helicase